MTKIKFLFFITLLVTMSCSKEETGIRLSGFETPIITGFQIRSIEGQLIDVYGIPNIKLSDRSYRNNTEYSFCPFPNPCTNLCVVHTNVPNPDAIKYIWVVQAVYEDNGSNNVTNIGSNTMAVGGAPLIENEFTSDVTALDISSLSEGYYRIYLKVDNTILYDNLVITNN
jgi:hypothetical protein